MRQTEKGKDIGTQTEKGKDIGTQTEKGKDIGTQTVRQTEKCKNADLNYNTGTQRIRQRDRLIKVLSKRQKLTDMPEDIRSV